MLASWTGWTSVQPFWYPLLFPPEQLGFFLQLVTLLIWFQLLSFVAQLKLQSSMLSWAKSRKLAVFPHAIGINEHKRHIWRLLIESFIPYAMQSVHLWLTDWSTDLKPARFCAFFLLLVVSSCSSSSNQFIASAIQWLWPSLKVIHCGSSSSIIWQCCCYCDWSLVCIGCPPLLFGDTLVLCNQLLPCVIREGILLLRLWSR